MPIEPVRPDAQAYTPPQRPQPLDPLLGSPESVTPLPAEIYHLLNANGHQPRGEAGHYPHAPAEELKALIASRLKIGTDAISLTCGADGGLEQVITAYIGPGRNLVTTVPGFGTVNACVDKSHGTLNGVPWWDGCFPVGDIIKRADKNTAIILITSPNNPTGQEVPFDAIARIRQEKPNAILVLDAVYASFADRDICNDVLGLPNTVVLRSFSKEGLASYRIGYAASSNPDIINAMRAAVLPYTVSGAAIRAAQKILSERQLRPVIEALIERVKHHRDRLQETLESVGLSYLKSQGNFVLAQCASAERAALLSDLLAGAGVGVRDFLDSPLKHLARSLRFGVPGESDGFQRLAKIIESCHRPGCLLFDAHAIGAGAVSAEDISMLESRGHKTAIVTDAGARALKPSDFRSFARANGNVCSGGINGVLSAGSFVGALNAMEADTGWYVGHSPSGVAAARRVSEETGGTMALVPIGFCPGGSNSALLEAGAARVIAPGGFSGLMQFPVFDGGRQRIMHRVAAGISGQRPPI